MKEALVELMKLIEDNVLVRNTDNDGDHDAFVTQGLRIVKVLQQAQAAIAQAKLNEAAPSMLEALQNLENDNNAIPEHAWKMVQEAIKKATS